MLTLTDVLDRYELVLSTLNGLTHLTQQPYQVGITLLCVIEEETTTQRGQVICLRSHSLYVLEPGFQLEESGARLSP